MERKCIIKNMSDEFYAGFGASIKGINNMTPAEVYETLKELARIIPKSISFKDEQFNRMVELNSLRKGPHSVELKIEPRRGYKLATFTFTQTKAA